MKKKKQLRVGLAIVDNKTIRVLNKKYLGKMSETDVISFDIKEETPEGHYLLGDIILSLDQVKNQAREYSVTEVTEFARVITHGVLHLLGYKDDNQIQKSKMTELEDTVLKDIFERRKPITEVDYIGVSVGAIIVNKEGKLLLSLRGKEVRNESGKWEFPGGGVHFNENLRDAIVREITEEYDLKIEVMELFHVADHIIKDEKQHWVATSFLCRVVRGEVKLMEPSKCDQVGWFALEELDELDLSIVTEIEVQLLKERYSKKLPDYYG